MSEWQPIETAPRDGTPVLIAGGEDDVARFVPDHEAFCTAPTRAAWISDRWFIAFADAGYVGVERLEPTHWMPLPKPPQ